MDMSDLFSSDGVRQALMEQSNPLISFQAGVLNRDSETNRITADPRKGNFQIVVEDDSLMHLQWRARGSANTEHDRILFPGETEFKQVASCPASARVYVLKWKNEPERLFFWMQGNEASQDGVHVRTVNSILEGGTDNQQAARTAGIDTTQMNTSNNSMETPSGPSINIENDSSPQSQPDVEMQTDSQTNPTSTPFQPLSAEQLREALAGRHSTTNQQQLLQQQRELVLTTPTLPDLLNVETLQPILENDIVKSKLPSLLEHLPEQDRNVDRITEILRSPQLRSQAASLSYALHSGHAPDILGSFGLPVSDTNSSYGLKAFIEALLQFESEQTNTDNNKS